MNPTAQTIAKTTKGPVTPFGCQPQFLTGPHCYHRARTCGRSESNIRTLVDVLEILPPEMIVERISGDAPPDYFIGPSWCLDKPGILLALRHELERRDTWQGKKRRAVP